MQNPTSSHQVGLASGALFALWYAAWSLLVLLGWAQALLNWIFSLHMIQLPFTVMPFSFVSAATLVIVTGAFGYVFGYVLGLIWNKVASRP